MTTKKTKRATKKVVESDVFKSNSESSADLKNKVAEKKRTIAQATKSGLQLFNDERARLIDVAIADGKLEKFQAQNFFKIRRDCNIARRMIKKSFENEEIQKNVCTIAQSFGLTRFTTCKLLSPESFDTQMSITIKEYKRDVDNQRTLRTEYWAGFVNAINALFTTSAHTSKLDCFIHINGKGFRANAKITPILIVNPKYARLFKSIDSTIESIDMKYIIETIKKYRA